MSTRRIRRGAAAVSLGLITAVGTNLMTTPVPAGAAGTTILHFYEVQQTATQTNAAGQPVTDPNATPQAGDHIDSTSLDYVGNHQHHTSSFTASDHFACTFPSASSATCNGQFAIGGSLLLANDVTISSAQSGAAPVQINAGTGKYKNARGQILATPIGTSNNSDITITLTG